MSYEKIPDMSRDVPDTITPPERLMIEWIEIDRLRVNKEYQRSVDKGTHRAIRKIVRSFSWLRFGIVSAAPIPETNLFEIIDGQHRTIAAKAIGCTHVPVVISDQATLKQNAADFVGINGDRSRVTPNVQFFAKVTAGDEGAMALLKVAQELGVNLLKYPRAGANYKTGDTLCIGVIEKLLKGHGIDCLRRVLKIVSGANLKPIRAEHIRSVKSLVTDELYAGTFQDEDVSEILRKVNYLVLKRMAAEHREVTGDSTEASMGLVIWRLVTADE